MLQLVGHQDLDPMKSSKHLWVHHLRSHEVIQNENQPRVVRFSNTLNSTVFDAGKVQGIGCVWIRNRQLSKYCGLQYFKL